MASLLLIGILLSILPFGELRTGIPFLISFGFDPVLAFIICTAANIAIIPILFLFFDYLHSGLMRFAFYRKGFAFALRRLRKKEEKMRKSIESYGLIALAVFTAIPLPFTGAYTAIIFAWLLGVERKRAAAFIAAGVLIAGILVTLASVGIIHLFKIF